MLRLRTEGIVAAAGASGFLFSDPNLAFAVRAQLEINQNVAEPVSGNPMSQQNAYYASARLAVGNNSVANTLFENYISALESSHPGQGSGPEHEPWMHTYMRWKNAGLDSAKFTRFRNQMVLWNTTAKLDPITAAGWTQNHQWRNIFTGVMVGEEWPGVNSGADSRYNFIKNTWLPQVGERYFKLGQDEYGSPVYNGLTVMCMHGIFQYSTDAGIRNIARFVRDQQLIMGAHEFALGQFAGIAQRTNFSNYGTPAYPHVWEQLLWLFFGGEQPHLVFEGPDEHPWQQGFQMMPFCVNPGGFSVPDLAWRINQAAHQQTHTFKHKEKENPNESIARPATEWPVMELYTRAPQRYAVGTSHFPNGYDVHAISGTRYAGQRIHWAIVFKSTGSDQSMFRISQDDNDTQFEGGSWFIPVSTHRSTCFGSEGVVLEVYNLPAGESKSFIEGFVPDGVLASSTSGNWRFMHVGACMIAVYFTAGFSIQSAKTSVRWVNDVFVQRPWIRSPGTGSATKLGLVIETAAPEDYVGGNAATQLANFQSAVTASRGGFAGGVNASQIGASQPQITYHALNGKTYVCQYMGVKSINGVPFDYDNAKRLESPWVQQDYGGDDMVVTDPGTGQVTRYRWSDKTITLL